MTNSSTVKYTGTATGELDDLLGAYLLAVADSLAEHGTAVRAVRIDEVDGPRGTTLTGSLTLTVTDRPRWMPSCLRWNEHTGWSAVLRHGTQPELGTTLRHLAGQLVPAPLTVAHFVAELKEDPNTIWSTAREQHLVPLDRRHLALEFEGYGYP